MAFFILCSSKKSVSALQMSRMLKLSYKAAWFMLHRIRFHESYRMLNGVVEVDGKGDRTTRFSRKLPSWP